MMTTERKIDCLLSELYEVLWKIRRWECITNYFVVFKGEDVDTVRPYYDYEGTQKAIKEINRCRFHLKSQVSKTRIQHYLEEEGMTIDELEMYRDDLKRRINTLDEILEYRPETKEANNGMVLETCCNYDEEIIGKEKDQLKIELDRINDTLDALYDSAIVSIEGTETQWEKMIEEKTQYIDSIIDKDLWNEYDKVLHYKHNLNDWIPFDKYELWYDWWDYVFWWK